jgi:DNA repair protein SbcD/Mre11
VIPARPSAAMRVLHTSDWHLGVTVRKQSRAEDHDAVIAEIVAIARAAAPDLILHTGDLFDGHPPPMAEFGRAIRALRALAEVAPVVVLAGNHDSAVVFDVLALALGDTHATDVAGGAFDPYEPTTNRIRVMSRPATPDRGGVLTFASKSGGQLRLAALPFVHANRVLVDFSSLIEPNATYNDQLRKIIALLAERCFTHFDPANDAAVFASHLHVRSARTSSEKVIHISDSYAADPAHISERFAYLAFGHIHVPQAITPGHGQYAGSVLEVDFGESGEAKRVVIADLVPGRPSAITSVPLQAGRRLHRLRAPLSSLAEHASQIANGIVEVTVTAEPEGDGWLPESDAHDTLSAAVIAALPDATVVSVIDARMPFVDIAADVDAVGTVETLGDSFRNWLIEAGGALVSAHGRAQAAPARIIEMFDELNAAGDDDTTIELSEMATLTRLLEDLT